MQNDHRNLSSLMNSKPNWEGLEELNPAFWQRFGNAEVFNHATMSVVVKLLRPFRVWGLENLL